MTVGDKLLQAQYRGVAFLTPTENKAAGKKTVKHDYPGSNRRFIEELGKLPPTFSLSAIVHGRDAINKRIQLENALEETGRGLLIHPIFGQIEVTATEYTSRSSDRQLGEFVFDITFEKTESNVTLNPSGSTANLVSDIAEETETSLDDGFKDLFKDVTDPDNLQEFTVLGIDLIGVLHTAANNLDNINPEQLSGYVTGSNTLETNMPVLVRKGANLIGSIRQNYNRFKNISDDIPSFFSDWLDLTSFNSNGAPIELTTQKRIDRSNNLRAIEDHTRVNALIGAYESAAYTNFDTDDDILTTQAALEGKYKELVLDAEEDSIATQPDVRQGINDLRVATRQVIEDKRQNVWRIVDIKPGESSIPLTAYRYYGDLENVRSLKQLNIKTKTSYFTDTIKGLT